MPLAAMRAALAIYHIGCTHTRREGVKQELPILEGHDMCLCKQTVGLAAARTIPDMYNDITDRRAQPPVTPAAPDHWLNGWTRALSILKQPPYCDPYSLIGSHLITTLECWAGRQVAVAGSPPPKRHKLCGGGARLPAHHTPLPQGLTGELAPSENCIFFSLHKNGRSKKVVESPLQKDNLHPSSLEIASTIPDAKIRT
ncbi:hypothetical protein BDZ91DRAFT_826639 [Kalaharituber pfeilii]|nr:hypothetical protein BDZ91DRAFT_826639 [Kalaharituber pfeilii]